MPVNMELLNDSVRRLYPGGLPTDSWTVTAIDIDAGIITLAHTGGGCRVYVGQVDAFNYYLGMAVNLSTGGTNRRRRAVEGIESRQQRMAWPRFMVGVDTAAGNDSIEMRCRAWANVIQSPPLRGITAWAALVDDTNVVAEPPKSKYREFTAAEIEAEPAW